MGFSVGFRVGAKDGFTVEGFIVGVRVDGFPVCPTAKVGALEGAIEGLLVEGFCVGAREGAREGAMVVLNYKYLFKNVQNTR